MDGGCAAGQIAGAVLGTFFSTLLLCVVVSAFIYRWRLSHLHDRRQEDVEKKRVDSQTYTNGGFRDPDTYESQRTLPLRQPVLFQSSAVALKTEESCYEASSKDQKANEYLQESVVQLALSNPDVIGLGFEICDGTENGVSGAIFVSKVMPEASNWLRSVMSTGDEIISITIDVTANASVSRVRAVLQQTVHCPVRMTLRRRRPTSSPNTQTVLGQPLYNNSPASVGNQSASRSSSPAGDSLAYVEEEQPELQLEQSTRMTYMLQSMASILQSEPAMFPHTVDYVNVTSDASVFPVQASENVLPDIEHVNPTTPVGPVTSSSDMFESAASDNEVFVGMNDKIVTDDDRNSDVDSFDSVDYVNITKVETDDHQIPVDGHHGLPIPATDHHRVDGHHWLPLPATDHHSLANGDEYSDSYVHVERFNVDNSNESLNRALAAGLAGPDRAGLDRALRAKERVTAGGVAYYVDLAPHFDEISGDSQDC